MGDRRFWFCVICASVIHAVVLWYLPGREQPRLVRIFDVQLQSIADPIAPQAIPLAPVRDTESVADDDTPTVRPTEPSTTPLAATKPDADADVPKPALRLARPQDWSVYDQPVDSTDGLTQAFRAELFNALESRRAEQARTQTLKQRNFALHGLPVAQYNALQGATSNHLKTAMGCFDLRMDLDGRVIGAKGLERRWWRTGCKDLLQTPWQMPALEFDPVGRAIGR